jgi:hypothetical protein
MDMYMYRTEDGELMRKTTVASEYLSARYGISVGPYTDHVL